MSTWCSVPSFNDICFFYASFSAQAFSHINVLVHKFDISKINLGKSFEQASARYCLYLWYIKFQWRWSSGCKEERFLWVHCCHLGHMSHTDPSGFIFFNTCTLYYPSVFNGFQKIKCPCFSHIMHKDCIPCFNDISHSVLKNIFTIYEKKKRKKKIFKCFHHIWA